MHKEKSMENIDKRNIPARKLGIVKFARSQKLSLLDIEFRQECIVAGLIPIRSFVNDLHFEYHTDDWFCYCDKFRELQGGEMTPVYEIILKRDGNHVLIDKVVEV